MVVAFSAVYGGSKCALAKFFARAKREVFCVRVFSQWYLRAKRSYAAVRVQKRR
jgi:hypothetical protein